EYRRGDGAKHMPFGKFYTGGGGPSLVPRRLYRFDDLYQYQLVTKSEALQIIDMKLKERFVQTNLAYKTVSNNQQDRMRVCWIADNHHGYIAETVNAIVEALPVTKIG
ncbi:hypothetical protein BGZ94_005541, partial [Podila epigama]